MKKKCFRCALITGASSGIGRELCYLLAKEGTDLIVVARREEKLKSLAEELAPKVSVEVVTADLSDLSQRKKVIEKIREKKPDLVVNNAGYGLYGEALSYKAEQMMNMVEVDVLALLEISIESAREMVVNKMEGVVMNVSSSAAFQIFPGFSVYAASKAFVNVFSESFDEELRKKGVRILACCPGMVDTEFRQRASSGKAEKASPYSMSAQFAANEIWKQILMGKPLRAFDWRYRLAAFLTKYLLPKRFIIERLRKNIEQQVST